LISERGTYLKRDGSPRKESNINSIMKIYVPINGPFDRHPFGFPLISKCETTVSGRRG